MTLSSSEVSLSVYFYLVLRHSFHSLPPEDSLTPDGPATGNFHRVRLRGERGKGERENNVNGQTEKQTVQADMGSRTHTQRQVQQFPNGSFVCD